MKHGDFTKLAKNYVDRPGYSKTVLNCIQAYIMEEMKKESLIVADVGAGTGKLTENLMHLNKQMVGFAVEPNDAMREEGIKFLADYDKIIWSKGTAEQTGLEESSVDWILMGSSFHWTIHEEAMAEFFRVLKPGGFFTAIWNPRNIQSSQLHMEIEEIAYKEIGNIKRVSSGNYMTSEEMAEKLMGTGYFEDMLFIEGNHEERMSIDRYMSIWKSVNDIQVQAGEKGFERILENIEKRLEGMDEIRVPYRSRSWSVRSKK
ncbi:MAG: class I SAM-dependent methyltransferase [Acetivibrio ethanolgignens]